MAAGYCRVCYCFYLQLIGNFLLRFVCSDDEVWVVAEALDSTFDVFAEDETNQVLLELNLIETLKSVMPQLKRKVSLVLFILHPLCGGDLLF